MKNLLKLFTITSFLLSCLSYAEEASSMADEVECPESYVKFTIPPGTGVLLPDSQINSLCNCLENELTETTHITFEKMYHDEGITKEDYAAFLEDNKKAQKVCKGNILDGVVEKLNKFVDSLTK